MKKILLFLLLIPTLQQAEEKKRKLSQETKIKTAVGVATAALAGFALYEGYKFYKSNYFDNEWVLCKLGNKKVQEVIRYTAATAVASFLGYHGAYQVTPDGKLDRAKGEMNKVNHHLVEICKKTNDPVTFYKEINQFFFYSHFPLITAFAQLDAYDNSLVHAEELLVAASSNKDVADECFTLLIEIKVIRKVLVEAMVTLKKHPEWSEQMNSRNLHAAARRECTREFCA
ncbi:hypothetical protein A3F06_03445 [candidate division TM6 bacterium RIFCSPHIGHO2_12_FULL_36_22]|nr:MAG: hypothetical protein A3F06_03445 [candidate division TM6 bacterium RIFCSPHIGHO2_12_FULL_36_22]